MTDGLLVESAAAAAVSWVLRNRAAAARDHRRATGRAHPEFGDGSLAGAARGLARRLADDAPALARSLAVCVAEAPLSSDPTAGALYLHHHWQSPAWAAALRATALIGPYLFLAFPSPEHPAEKESPYARHPHHAF